jgi:hypothetical protein
MLALHLKARSFAIGDGDCRHVCPGGAGFERPCLFYKFNSATIFIKMPASSLLRLETKFHFCHLDLIKIELASACGGSTGIDLL